MEHEALECLIEFSKFCSRLYRDKSCDESFTKAAKRAMKYALLYVMFFFRFASSRDFNEKKVKESMELLINIFGRMQVQQNSLTSPTLKMRNLAQLLRA